MKPNQFHGCSQPIGSADLDACETVLKNKLPSEFRQHYLKYNGGIPEDNLFPGNGEWEPLEVTGFYPIKHKKSVADSESSLLIEHYHLMLGKDVIPDRMLPFACDPGGNFFCLDLHDGSVHFYATDGFDPTLSVAENFVKAQRRLAGSFESFMDDLTHNAEYDLDEWPE
jgi:cell wall assembly regulator SMI1